MVFIFHLLNVVYKPELRVYGSFCYTAMYNCQVFLIISHFRILMARQEGQLLVDLKTNHPDVVTDIRKIVLGERSRGKASCNQRRQR